MIYLLPSGCVRRVDRLQRLVSSRLLGIGDHMDGEYRSWDPEYIKREVRDRLCEIARSTGSLVFEYVWKQPGASYHLFLVCRSLEALDRRLTVLEVMLS